MQNESINVILFRLTTTKNTQNGCAQFNPLKHLSRFSCFVRNRFSPQYA